MTRKKELIILYPLSAIIATLSIYGFLTGATWFGLAALGPFLVLVIAILIRLIPRKVS